MFVGKFLAFLACHFSAPDSEGFVTVGTVGPAVRNRFSE
jgi:hypothetical protein